MKYNGLIVMLGVIALMISSCGESTLKNAKIKSQEDSLSYAFGIVNYNNLTSDSLMLKPVIVAKAMLDGEKGEPLMDDDVARAYIMMFINQRESKQAEAQAELNKEIFKEHIAQNEAFLTENKGKNGVIVTPSGLQYEVIKMGNGPKPTTESVVRVHYVGTLIDGTQFDSSVERGEPAEFPVTGVIAGWTEALQLMPVGSKFKLYLPEALAYGPSGAGDIIQPYSTLIFEVELLDIIQ
jgi:FKBP-type peptidyl-prolyl cis-trans isomerase FklB